MKKTSTILLIAILLGLGFPLRNVLVESLIKNSTNSNYNQIAKSLSTAPQISIWGSSTAYINFDAETVQNKSGVSCCNFGISGAFYNQQHHLVHFSEHNQNKNLIWVINPFEFKEDVKSKLNEASYFTPFSHDLGNDFDYFFGWRQIFNFNAEHWALAITKKEYQEFNQYGNHLITRYFQCTNGYHEDVTPFNFSNDKIAEFNKIANQISTKNNLIIVLPPYLGKTEFMGLKAKLEVTIIDYSDWSKNKDDFHDYIHLNEKATLDLSNKLATDLKPLLR